MSRLTVVVAYSTLDRRTMVCDTYVCFRSTAVQGFQGSRFLNDRQSDTFDKFRESNEPTTSKQSYAVFSTEFEVHIVSVNFKESSTCKSSIGRM